MTHTIHPLNSPGPFEAGDYVISDYGRGLVVSQVRASGRLWAVDEKDVPFSAEAFQTAVDATEDRINAAIAEALAPFTPEWDYDRTLDDFLAGTGRR